MEDPIITEALEARRVLEKHINTVIEQLANAITSIGSKQFDHFSVGFDLVHEKLLPEHLSRNLICEIASKSFSAIITLSVVYTKHGAVIAKVGHNHIGIDYENVDEGAYRTYAYMVEMLRRDIENGRSNEISELRIYAQPIDL